MTGDLVFRGKRTPHPPRDAPPLEESQPHEPPHRPRSVRFYIVWAARLLLPLVYLLSTAKLVTIPSPSPHSHSHSHSQAQVRVQGPEAAFTLLVVTHARAEYLSRALWHVLRHHPGGMMGVPIVVSVDQQDGEHPAVDRVIARFAAHAAARAIPFTRLAHARSYDDDAADRNENDDARRRGAAPPPPLFADERGYRRIARHYRWALQHVFAMRGVSRVVIVEDDMQIAPDFYDYFSALAPLLERDPSLYCVSAWNDNGIDALSRNASQLYRTDFFPGLGWMLSRALWQELEPKWPPIYWDDWMRHPDQTKGRQCIRPEVSRTANFGQKGVSSAFHYNHHISKVVLSNRTVDFAALDLSYLQWQRYHEWFFTRFSKAMQLPFSNYLTTRPQDADVIAFYPQHNVAAIGKRTGIMMDQRNGVFRTSYHDVIVIPWNGHWAFIVPKEYRPPVGYQLGSTVCCK